MLQPLPYVESRALSQSDLKKFRRSMIEFYRQVEQGDRTENIATKATDMGDIVDCMTTNPDGLKDYMIVEGVKCSDAIKNIVINAFSDILQYSAGAGLNEMGLRQMIEDAEAIKPFVVSAGRNANYQSRYGDDALYNTITKEGGGVYLKSLIDSHGRNIIDKEVYDQSERCKDKFYNDGIIGPLLRTESGGDLEVLKQYILFGRYSNTDQKGLLDFGIANHSTQEVWPYDIKTTYQMSQFIRNYYKSGYGYQGSYYTDLLQQKYPGYKIHPFRFIVGTTETDEAPLIYKMQSTEIAMFADGGFTRSSSRVVGWKETIREIEWHRQHQRWDYPMKYYDSHEILIDSIYSETDEKDPL
jgi:hypothetical protein